ncbi:hypothetical protein CMUS01_08588 [Colletotrichum musicola]|uniref:Uncharacterized protein n=1 Tax=Colletotrichum musicola TaxID=2175873 RepID=A0A8H6KBU2_9PEZI|nr:hypothetical protein CMUS01_08588 [Colletotrichum musicola]
MLRQLAEGVARVGGQDEPLENLYLPTIHAQLLYPPARLKISTAILSSQTSADPKSNGNVEVSASNLTRVQTERDRESRKQRRGGGDGGGGRGGDGDRPFACKGSPSPSTPPSDHPSNSASQRREVVAHCCCCACPSLPNGNSTSPNLLPAPPPHQSTTTTSPNPARGLATSALWAGFHPHSGWPKPPPGLTPGLVPVGRRPGSKLTVRVRVAQPLRGKQENNLETEALYTAGPDLARPPCLLSLRFRADVKDSGTEQGPTLHLERNDETLK